MKHNAKNEPNNLLEVEFVGILGKKTTAETSYTINTILYI